MTTKLNNVTHFVNLSDTFSLFGTRDLNNTDGHSTR